MARGVNIPIAADASGVIREGKKVEGALEDVIDSLDDVGDAGKQSGKDVEKGLDGVGSAAKDAGKDVEHGLGDSVQDATKSAGDDVETLEKKFRDSFDAVKKDAKEAGSSIGDDVKKGTKEAEEGTDTLKENANANAKEVAASFDGSAQSIADGFQGLAAEAFEGFGPAGAAAGVAAGIGIGLVSSALQKSKEQAQEAAEKVADLAGEMIDLGKSDLGAEQIEDALKDMATAAKDGKIPLDELRKTATKAGIDYNDYARGIAGDSGAIQRSYDEVTKGLADYSDGLSEITTKQPGNVQAINAYVTAHEEEFTALEASKKKLLEKDATLDQSAETYQNYKDAMVGVTDATKEGTTATEAAAAAQEAAATKAQAYSDTLTGLVEPAGLYTDAQDDVKTAAEEAARAAGKSAEDIAKAGEDAQVTLDDVLTELAQKVQQRKDFEANLKNLADRGFLALSENLKAKGPEAAGSVTALLAAGTNAQVQQYSKDTFSMLGTTAATSTAGGLSSASSQAAIQSAVNSTVGGITVPSLAIPLTVHSTVITTEVRRLSNGNYQTYVNGRPVGNQMV